jgi:threonine dehydratase
MPVTFEDIRAAADAIRGSVVETPCVKSETLSQIAGAELFLKLESLQYTASFKDRGALNRMLALAPEERDAGVIAMSAGNHAQSVAYHARRLGVPATIVMPKATPFVKIRNTEMLGAEIVLHGDSLEEASDHANGLAREEGLTFIHPYDDDLVIAGQGTVGLEMLDSVPDLEMVVVPVGGGGLIAGVATAVKALRPEIEVYGVEAALCPSMREALAGQRPSAHGLTIAEGIAVKTPGMRTLPIVEATVEDILLVAEGEIEYAVHLMAEIEKLVTEGAGAAALAAVLAHAPVFAGRRVGLIVSGGNIDSRLLASVLMRGLVRDGRLARVRVEVSDIPGSLARVTEQIGALGGNIVEVEHERWFQDVPARLTEVDFLIETMDREATRALIEGLVDAGYTVRRLSSTALDEE